MKNLNVFKKTLWLSVHCQNRVLWHPQILQYFLDSIENCEIILFTKHLNIYISASISYAATSHFTFVAKIFLNSIFHYI